MNKISSNDMFNSLYLRNLILYHINVLLYTFKVYIIWQIPNYNALSLTLNKK